MEQEIKNITQEFLTKLAFDFNSVDTSSDDNGIWVSVETPDSRNLIGRNGETLHFVNYLIRRIVETRFKDQAPRVTVDVNSYQKQKIEKVKTIAHMMAERARFFKSSIELPPMNAFERRVVHDFVSHHHDIASASEGVGAERHVVISYLRDQDRGDTLSL